MIEAIDQRAALHFQLVAIAGHAPATCLFEIRAFRNGRARQTFVPIGELDRAAAAIRNQAQLGDVYVGALPRTREGGTIADVEQSHILWADFDSSDGARAFAARLRAARMPLPTLVIRTGTPGHLLAIWVLSKPLAAAHIRRANRRIALASGADRGSCDAARVIRAAGTLNFKHTPPAPVVCTRLTLDVFSLEDVVGGLPDDPTELRLVQPARESRPGGQSGDLDGLLKTVGEAQSGNRNAVLYWAACRVRDEGLALDDARSALAAAAVAAGLSEREAERTIDSALTRKAAA